MYTHYSDIVDQVERLSNKLGICLGDRRFDALCGFLWKEFCNRGHVYYEQLIEEFIRGSNIKHKRRKNNEKPQ